MTEKSLEERLTFLETVVGDMIRVLQPCLVERSMQLLQALGEEIPPKEEMN